MRACALLYKPERLHSAARKGLTPLILFKETAMKLVFAEVFESAVTLLVSGFVVLTAIGSLYQAF